MRMDKPLLHGPDPKTAVAIAEYFVGIDLAVREQRIRIGCTSNLIRFEFVASEPLESSALHADQQPSVVGRTQVTQPHSRRLVLFGGARFPLPKPGLRGNPESS